jgi:hypothetical protein
MPAVPITLVGISTDDTGQARSVTFVGMASITGLQVGGGPMPGGKPPVISGGPIDPYPDAGLPMPQPPRPPVISGGPIDPYPDAGLPLPQPPNGGQPPEGGADKPPPDGGGWGYWSEYGWGYFPKATEAGPKGGE